MSETICKQSKITCGSGFMSHKGMYLNGFLYFIIATVENYTVENYPS